MSDHDADLARFLAGEPVAIDDTLRTLPRTANVARAVEVVLRLIDHPHWLAGSGKLPAALVRGVITARATHPSHVFLQLAVPGNAKAAQLKAAWHAGVRALHELADTTHPLESEARRAQLAAIAQAPPLLAGVQGVAANTAEVPLAMLIVLAIDGSDTSLDAMIPHLDLALGSRDARLERLALVRPFVRPSPALDALFAELDAALQLRRSTSPALAFGEAIGAGELPLFWFSFQPSSVQRNELSVPRVQGSVRVDSREDPWFAVEISTVEGTHDRTGDRATRFDHVHLIEDALGLGRCEPAELPAWLRRAARALSIKWDKVFVRSNADAKLVKDWLTTR